MANQKHFMKLKQGVKAWNEWRKLNPDIRPDLSRAKLPNANLYLANFCGASLKAALLEGSDLNEADLSEADLSKANIFDAKLDRAILINANLKSADLGWANFVGAQLKGANLSGANLSQADFSGADLTTVDMSYSTVWQTTFADVDLRFVKGLETLTHDGPSSIGIDTVYRSQGKIPESFLRGAGVPENFITFMHSLVGKPFDYYSCFISYSSKDQDFAKLLHAGLQQEGVRCWYAPEDLKTGDKFRQRIDEAIRIYDKLLVVLSENSTQSSWVEDEVEGALEKERQQNKLALFPVRLDNAVMKTDQAWAASLRRTRHIADFTKWKDHDSYQSAFKRLLRDLQGKDAAAVGIETIP